MTRVYNPSEYRTFQQDSYNITGMLQHCNITEIFCISRHRIYSTDNAGGFNMIKSKGIFAQRKLDPREIPFAVVRAVLEINQIRLVRSFEVGTRRSEPGRSSTAALRQSHQSGTLVQGRQGDSGHPERRQSSPAHAHAAGARHTWCNGRRKNYSMKKRLPEEY